MAICPTSSSSFCLLNRQAEALADLVDAHEAVVVHVHLLRVGMQLHAEQAHALGALELGIVNYAFAAFTAFAAATLTVHRFIV